MRLLYSTFPTRDEAISTARALLDERLIACANIMPQGISLYRWEGEVAEAQEHVLLAKTSDGRVEAAMERLIALHSYDVPCAMVLPVEASAAFREWVEGA